MGDLETAEGLGWSASDIVGHLKTTSVFRRLDDELLERIASSASILTVRAGDVVMAEGDTGADAFVVIAGRLDVLIGDGDSAPVGSLGAGDVVGEMALLTDEPRSATVSARRDAALLRIPASEFRAIVFDHPEVLLDVTRTVMHRLNRSIHDIRPERRTTVVAILPAGSEPRHREFASLFTRATDARTFEVITADRVRAELRTDSDPSRIAPYLHLIEDRNDLVVLVGDPEDADWSALCERQSDVSLLVGHAEGLGQLAPYEHTDTEGSVTRHLVLVQRGSMPTDTAGILRQRRTDRHHHVREGSVADVARVERIVRGTSLGVVFGGGGARGFAHLGVVKALWEAGIAIDHVAGSSIGSSAAGGVAMGWDWDYLVEAAKWVTYERGSPVDLTFPSVALGSGKRLTDGMRKRYGDTDIEDLWIEFLCVSTDLTAGNMYVHRTGRLWRAVRSSIAIPGLLPPMPSEEGHVLVDGGVLDNLPVSTMQDVFAPQRIIAVDVRAETALPADGLAAEGAVSGWRILGGSLPGVDRPRVPGIVETLLAASTVSGHTRPAGADLVISPDVSGFGMLDFARADELIERGYEHAAKVLERASL